MPSEAEASRAHRIEAAIRQTIRVDTLQLEDESYKHSVPEGAESHFKLTCASGAFAGLSRVKRHQMVYGHLQSEFGSGLHALALHCYAPDEWQDKQAIPASPDCKKS